MQCIDYKAIKGTITVVLSPAYSPLPWHHCDSKSVTAVKPQLSFPLPRDLPQFHHGQISHVTLMHKDIHIHKDLFNTILVNTILLQTPIVYTTDILTRKLWSL